MTETVVKPFPLIDIYFNSDFQWFVHGDYAQLEILSIVALLIMLVSIINYTNLATAQVRNRSREIGIKKITGASRLSVFTQFYLESAFMVSVAFFLAIFVVELLKGQLYFIVGKHFELSYFEPRFLLGMSAGLLVIFILAGLYPAIHLSSFDPIKSIKGQIITKKSVLRHSSVIIQYSVCVMLIVGTIALQKQLKYLQSKDLGFDMESVVRFEFFNEELRISDRNERNALLNKLRYVFDELNGSSFIEAVGRSEFPLYDGFMDCWGFDNDPKMIVPLAVGGADDNFTKLYDIKLIEGRFFGDPHPTDSTIKSSRAGVVINRAASEQLFAGDAVGKRFTTSSWGEKEVIGVLEDFNYQHLSLPIKPLFLYRTSRDPVPVVRFAKGRLHEGMDFVHELHKEVGLGIPFSYEFLDQRLGGMYEKDRATTELMSSLSIIALLISSLGLFALSAYIVELRVREIGIRKVNGAGIYNIFTMLTKDFLKWVIYAMIISIPFSWFLINYWFQNYAFRTDITWWIFALAGMIVLVVSWITISYHSTRAAYTNPVEVLRSE